ncbi:type II toxin-antitoxin system HicB family antitoxin [Orbus mooreae]|uniref:type II toxin-antitoxin system HicB family antitoxin n=1 Tax=Orbus mooreae TaxID=3074107 RepID=UPI00370D75E2
MLYPVAIELGDENHAYGVIVPDIAGCFSAGDTMEEALESTKEAIASHIEILVGDGEKIPAPTDIKNYINNDEYKGLVFAVVDVDLTHLMGGAEKINITLPKKLLKEIDRIVASNPKYKSRSGFLADVSLEKVIRL